LVGGAWAGNGEARLYLGRLAVATLPILVCGYLAESGIERIADSPLTVSALLAVTGLALLSLRWAPPGGVGLTWGRAFLIGCAQAVAVLPGISRSGSTIVTARHMGLAPAEAAEFSFLLSIPAVAAACVWKGAHFRADEFAGMGPGLLLAGMAVSAVVGYICLALLNRWLRSPRFPAFGWYCLALALGAGLLLAR